jgi:putative ATP-binding cassette transporter
MNIRKGYTRQYILFTLLSILSGLGSMGVIWMINRFIDAYFSHSGVNAGRYLLYFLLTLILFMASRWAASITILRFTQRLLIKLRLEVMQLILRSSYRTISGNKGKIFGALTRDTDNIVMASVSIVDISTNVAITLICFVYMAFLSWKLLLCVLVVLGITLVVYFLSVKKSMALFRKAMVHQDSFIKYLNEVLNGFKEITIERRKGAEITDRHIRKAINDSSGLQQKARIYFLNNRIIGLMAFYIFIGLLLLFLGNVFDIQPRVVVNFIFLILYVFGPIETLVLLIPNLAQANVSLQRINQIEAQITDEGYDPTGKNRYDHFSGLRLEGINYRYPATEGKDEDALFGIGPIGFGIDAGEVVFISGGNGSGKTTFVNILIGLFESDEGEFYVNGKQIGNTKLPEYHGLFAPVFNDFHLFDELYGIERADPEKVMEYLSVFELEKKVSFEGYKFSTIDLSAGQRKRLALIYAMLEGKPIVVLDEFAADQDPYFKRKFYLEIIPYIRSQGFTVIAITHDEHYYPAADKLYKMDAGLLYEMGRKPRPVLFTDKGEAL